LLLTLAEEFWVSKKDRYFEAEASESISLQTSKMTRVWEEAAAMDHHHIAETRWMRRLLGAQTL